MSRQWRSVQAAAARNWSAGRIWSGAPTIFRADVCLPLSEPALRSGTDEVLFIEPVFPVPVTLPSGIRDRWHAEALFTILITGASARSHPSSDQSEATFTPSTQVAPSDVFPSCYTSVPRAGGNWSAAYTRQKQIWRTVAAGEPRTPCQINEQTFTISWFTVTVLVSCVRRCFFSLQLFDRL